MLSREWPLKNCSRDTALRMRRVSSEFPMQGPSANNHGERERTPEFIQENHPTFDACCRPSQQQHNSFILCILISHFCFIIVFCLGGNVSS